MSEISTAYSALKAAYEIAKGLKDINDKVKLNSAIIDLQERILTAQDEAVTTRKQLTGLEHQLDELRNWETTRDQYTLKDARAGSYVYEPLPDSDAAKIPHLACTTCFGEQRISPLQTETWNPGRAHVLRCHTCGTAIYLSGHPHPDHPKRRID